MKSIIQKKKGIGLSESFGAVLAVVLLGVLVIIAIVLFVSLGNTFASTVSAGVNGESLTPSGNASDGGTFVSNATLCRFGAFNLITATNSSGFLIDAANYTTTSTGQVRNVTTLATATAAPWTLNYTFTWGSEACEASDDLVTQFATYPALVGLVGTIIFLGIVIGVLVASFVFGGRKGV